MANPTTGQFQDLVAAATEATRSLQFSNQMIRSVYVDYKPVETMPGVGVTLNILIPTVNEGDTNDIQGGALQVTDTGHDLATLQFNHNDSNAFIIPTWDMIRTPVDLQTLYLQPRIEGLLRKINRRLANLVTSTSFPNYTTIGASNNTFTRAELATAWYNLSQAGVPTEDAGDMFMMVGPLAYSQMMGNTDFYQESIVGVEASVRAAQRALLAPSFNATIRWDQQIPKTSSVESGLFFHRKAIALVTRPLPQSDVDHVMETTIYPVPGVNLPVRIQLSYDMKLQGWLVALNCATGVAVIRPDHGCYMQTT